MFYSQLFMHFFKDGEGCFSAIAFPLQSLSEQIAKRGEFRPVGDSQALPLFVGSFRRCLLCKCTTLKIVAFDSFLCTECYKMF